MRALWVSYTINTSAQFLSMDCGRVSFCLLGDPDYFSITTRPWLPHSSQSFTINCGLFAAILDENVGIYKFFHNFNKQQARLQKFFQFELEFKINRTESVCSFNGWKPLNIWMQLFKNMTLDFVIMLNFCPAYALHNWELTSLLLLPFFFSLSFVPIKTNEKIF